MISTINLDAVDELQSILDMLRWTVSRFHEAQLYYGHGTDNAWDEARSLLLQSLHLPQDALHDSHILQARLTSQEKQDFLQLVRRRVEERIPVAYITNQAWFCELPFYVDERVLVPRSPFAELIQKKFDQWLTQEPKQILDLCTGSGCIAIALAYAFEGASVDAVDLSEEALAVADININEHDLTDRVFPIQSDLMQALEGQKYDLIVSNPPYVDAEDMSDLPDEFHHEPELGLAAGQDGLDLVDGILAQAVDHLSEDGWLFVEVGNSQVHMDARFWGLDPQWIEFEHGGSGVFAISRKQLVEYWSSKAS